MDGRPWEILAGDTRMSFPTLGKTKKPAKFLGMKKGLQPTHNCSLEIVQLHVMPCATIGASKEKIPILQDNLCIFTATGLRLFYNFFS
jgi:hypothetical protein